MNRYTVYPTFNAGGSLFYKAEFGVCMVTCFWLQKDPCYSLNCSISVGITSVFSPSEAKEKRKSSRNPVAVAPKNYTAALLWLPAEEVYWANPKTFWARLKNTVIYL